MKLICAAIGMAAMCAAGLHAQTSMNEIKETRKIEVKDGTEITLDGCLANNPGGGYMLATPKGAMIYALVTDDDLSRHVGHRIEVTGKAADKGDGKVTIETTAVGTSGSGSAKAVSELTGDMAVGLHYI